MRIVLAVLFFATVCVRAASVDPAVSAVNALGLELLRAQGAGQGNKLLSPYSIQSVLAMAYAGADGRTRAEMTKALHFPAEEKELHRAFLDLRRQLANEGERVPVYALESPRPFQMAVANQLFVQTGYNFKPSFVSLLATNYGASFAPMDFLHNAGRAGREINNWVSEQTHNRIKNVIGDGALSAETRLVLVNAIYFKARWQEEFTKQKTTREPFHIRGGETKPVPTMVQEERYGYMKYPGYQVATIPYNFCGIQFVVVLPDKTNGLSEVEKELTPDLFASWKNLTNRLLDLHLPKFKMESSTMDVSTPLKDFGMTSAFDRDRANFDRMALPQSDGRLYVSAVLHNTFINVDEEGTEAAGATAFIVNAATLIGAEKPRPIVFKVDRPFVFAIQDKQTGVCLFLGRVSEPAL